MKTARLYEQTQSGLLLPPLPPASMPRKVKPGSCGASEQLQIPSMSPVPPWSCRPSTPHLAEGSSNTGAENVAQLQQAPGVQELLCSALTSPSLSPQSNFLGNSAVAFPPLSPNKYHAKQDEYLLPRPSSMTHFLNQGRCNWALESWTPPKAERFCNNYSKKQKE